MPKWNGNERADEGFHFYENFISNTHTQRDTHLTIAMYFIFIGWRSTFSLSTLSHLSIRFHYIISRTIVLYSPIYYYWYAAPTVCNNGEFDSEKINLNVSDGVRKICREFRV